MTALTLAALGFGFLLISAGWADRSVADTLKSVLAGEELPPTAPLFEVTHSQDAWAEAQSRGFEPVTVPPGSGLPPGWVPGQDTGNITQ